MSGRVGAGFSIADAVRRNVDRARLRDCMDRLRGNLHWAEVEAGDGLRYAEAEGVTETPIADAADLKGVARAVKDALRLTDEVLGRLREDAPENGRETPYTASDGKEAEGGP